MYFWEENYFHFAMTDLEAYNNCLEQIELYRSKREQIMVKNDLLQKRIDSLLATNINANVSAIQAEIDENQRLDEEYGAKMHQLTIQRNLLEP